MKTTAHAKLNVGLKILGRRKDGFHDLESVFIPLELHDTITIEILPKGFIGMLTSDSKDLSTGEDNLVTVAIETLRSIYHFTEQFSIHIEKRIPIGAGLGGGTSDAISSVKLVARMLNITLSVQDIERISRKVGADARFFFDLKPSFASSIGDKLLETNIKKAYSVLLVVPANGLRTKDVFSEYDRLPSKKVIDMKKIQQYLEESNIRELANHLDNDLIDAAIRLDSSLEKVNSFLTVKKTKYPVSMTGSGSTFYILGTNQLSRKITQIKAKKLGLKTIVTKFYL